jgi:hypothetical protein
MVVKSTKYLVQNPSVSFSAYLSTMLLWVLFYFPHNVWMSSSITPHDTSTMYALDHITPSSQLNEPTNVSWHQKMEGILIRATPMSLPLHFSTPPLWLYLEPWH